MLAVTGAGGFIGRYIIPKLGMETRCLVRRVEDSLHPHSDVLGDLQNVDDIKKLVKHADILLHLACSSIPRTSDRDLVTDVQSNLLSSISLFQEYAKINREGHIIYFSTGGAMYNITEPRPPVKESEPPVPWSGYGIHKLAAEHYLRLICRTHNIRGTIFRIANPYGTFLPPTRKQGLIGTAFTCASSNQTLDIFDSLETVRDYIHLDDIVRLLALTIERPSPRGKVDLYHVGTGIGTSIRQVLSSIESITGLKIRIHILSRPDQRATYNVLDCSLVQHRLGWTAAIGIKEGLSSMWASQRPLH